MSVEVRQLTDRGTGESFVPITHWNAVSTKPNVVINSPAGSVSDSDLQVQAVIPTVDLTSDSGTSYELDPNKFYLFGEKAILTITLATEQSGIVNEYVFQFDSGSTATSLYVPNTVDWMDEPDIQANKTYQVSIINNLGVIGEWS